MDLVGAWLRQLLRAGGAAALVPLAMVASLAVVVAGGGGLGGLGALGQLVTGPAISPAQRSAAASSARDSEVALVAPPASVATGRPRAPSRATAVPEPKLDRAAPRRPGPAPPAPPAHVVPRPHRLPLPPAAPVASRPPAPPAPGPTAKGRAKALVGQLGETIGEVGAVVAEIIDALAKTLGGILLGPPSGR